MSRCAAGFTLLELLIAISIFALLGLGTYQMLHSVLRTDAATRAQEQQLRELVRAMAAFERDVLQAQRRPIRDPYGDARAALLGESREQDSIELTRSGWRNPLGGARSDLQRVRWSLSGEQWLREFWTVLDQAQDSQPQVQEALDGVTSLRLRYLNKDYVWIDSWPPVDGELAERMENLPLGIEMQLQHRRFGELRRVLRLPDGPPNGRPGNAEGSPSVAGGGL